MLKSLFTLDYEIHGNGDGSPLKLMVEPTDRLLRVADRHGAKVTIMADVAEILTFREHARRTGRDEFDAGRIEEQLRRAVRTGHDVQLHLHPSYFGATREQGSWRQNWAEYNFAGLPAARMTELVRIGKEYLETLLRPVAPGYRCFAFRAANWSVNPSLNVVTALADNGIRIDTSIFKYGKRTGIVSFDYTEAWSPLIPWPADRADMCRRSEGSPVFEFPIYSELRRIPAFLTLPRIARALSTSRHPIAGKAGSEVPAAETKTGSGSRVQRKVAMLFAKHAWKADFNQCSAAQLVRALNRADRQASRVGADVPFVLIGHSKLFSPMNERRLARYLDYVRRNSPRLGFGTFGDFDLAAFS